MGITNSDTCPQQRSLSPPPDLLSSSSIMQQPPYNPTIFSPMIMTMPPSHQHTPHVLVSRINARLSSNIIRNNGADSKHRLFAQDDESRTDDDSWSSMSTNGSIFGHTSTSSSVSSSLSYKGRWCEEERAIPLKKRRVVMVSYETIQSKEMMGRCNRENGKGWRCKKMRVKGHSLCKHHLELQRMRNINCFSNTSNQGEAAAATPNQIRMNKRVRVVKARSITSLLRDTVPLL
ncbi:hypothetical protein PTKIN_Ptkin06aG0080300 [Pterospermum kingtungense]